MPIENLVGRRFGRLVVDRLATERTKSGRVKWVAKCDYSNEKSIQAINLKSGDTTSCGCAHVEQLVARNTTHGLSRSSEYLSWSAMLSRCNNPDGADFRHYGGRGISVCDRWQSSFENFLADMGVKPGPKYGVERENVDGNYEPNNCCWATQAEQVRNTRSNVRLSVDGNEMIAVDAARQSSVRPSTLYSRVRRGWSDWDVVNAPVQSMRYRTVKIDGIEMTLPKAAAARGLKLSLIHDRLRYGWTLDDALAMPPGSRNPRKQV